MNKNIAIPITIIIVGLLIGGAVFWSGGQKKDIAASENLRQLELSVPGMFCAGCAASVEGYVSSVPGVKRVSARLTPTKSATIIYDSDKTSKETIVKNQIFDTYGATVLSDEPYSGSIVSTQSKDGITVPQDIQEKSQIVSRLLRQKSNDGKDTSASQSLFNQVNSDIDRGDFANAGALLDTIISSLQNL